jgi:type IV pilus assembly protein PilQ
MIAGGATVVVAVQPAFAAPVLVTGVELNPNGNGINLVLQTQKGERPQVFAVNRGTTWTADLTNTQLKVPGGTFQQANPVPGINLVTVKAVDPNNVRVTVVGQGAAPAGQVVRPETGGVVLSLSPSTAKQTAYAATGKPLPAPKGVPTAAPTTTATKPAGTSVNQPPTVSVQPIAVPPPEVSTTSGSQFSTAPSSPRPALAAPLPSQPSTLAQVPMPSVPSSGVSNPALPAGPLQSPPSTIPPMLPRAVPPPVGDISVSQLDASAATIDLGTAQRIPRLVLRDAPVREVLSLLARAANLNLAWSSPPATQGGQGAIPEPTITLDIENEAVQDVFNHVLRVTCVPVTASAGAGLSGTGPQCAALEANLVGRTIFVGPKLPDAARNVISRTLRLNQASVIDAAAFLAIQGAETRQFIPSQKTLQSATPQGGGPTITTETITDPKVVTVKVEGGQSPAVLQGLSVSTDPRLNTVTLTGIPRKVEIATALLTQLDARKRQVVVNVKIIDVNLRNREDFSTSFSFGVGDQWFTVDGGAAYFNFGNYRPPTNLEAQRSLVAPTVGGINYPTSNFGAVAPFVDVPRNSPFGNPTPATGILGTPTPSAIGRAPFGTNGNPFAPGVTEFTPGTPPTATSPGTPPTFTFALPGFFQWPQKFLASLQAQIVSGNAKILTDPSLTIQEGETSTVRLTQNVVTNITTDTTSSGGVVLNTTKIEQTPAGLTLGLAIDRIDDNGFITLRVNPKISAPADVFNTGNGVVTLLAEREVQSGRIRLRDGQTLILSGIISDSDRSTVRKVPILGDIPLLGALFRSNERENQRNEVIVLLTPRIMDDNQTSTFGYGYVPGPAVRQVIDQSNRTPR